MYPFPSVFNFSFPHVLAVVQTEWFDCPWGDQAVYWQSQGRDGSGVVGVWGFHPVSEVDLTKGGRRDQSIVEGEEGADNVLKIWSVNTVGGGGGCRLQGAKDDLSKVGVGGGGCHLMQSIFTAYCDAWVCVCVHAWVSGGWGIGGWNLIEWGGSVWIRQFVYGCCVTYLCEKIDSKFSKYIFFFKLVFLL